MSETDRTERKKPKPTARTQPGTVPPLRARDTEQVIETGVDVGLAEGVPSAEKDAHVDSTRFVQRDRFRPITWYLAIIAAIVLVAVLLGLILY